MSLDLYFDPPFNEGTVIYPDDTYTGDGVTTTFTLVQKSATQLGSTIQAGAVQYYQYLSGFTKNTSNDTFTLSTAPPLGVPIIAPGVSALVLSAFDQEDVDGVTDPRIDEEAFYLYADDIGLYTYSQLPGASGIELSFQDLDTNNGATLAWVQLACADVDGSALTYQATGTSLYTDVFSAFGTVASSTWAGSTTILCNTASSFTNVLGDYLTLGWGASSEEVVHLTNVSGTTMTVSAMNFEHPIGETIHDSGRKFFAKLTVPEDATGGEAVTLYDLGLRRRALKVSRL